MTCLCEVGSEATKSISSILEVNIQPRSGLSEGRANYVSLCRNPLIILAGPVSLVNIDFVVVIRNNIAILLYGHICVLYAHFHAKVIKGTDN